MREDIIEKNVSLKPYNSWRVGGEADYLALPRSLEDIKDALMWAKTQNLPVTYLGAGSNVLISDKGIRGLVLSTKKYAGIEDVSTKEHLKIICKAGTLKVKAMRRFLKEGLSPALFLSGLPGDVAGGVVMNAGVSEAHIHPREFNEIVDSFQVLTLNESDDFDLSTYSVQDIQWSYRKSEGWKEGLIVEVTLKWPKEPKDSEIKKKVDEARELRKSKQPLDQKSCGSVFTNPFDHPANTEKRSSGYLIEKAGLKGYEYGGAQISRKHANFIINTGEAKALDMHCAIQIAKEKVKHLFGVDLKTEVRYIGDWEGLL